MLVPNPEYKAIHRMPEAIGFLPKPTVTAPTDGWTRCGRNIVVASHQPWVYHVTPGEVSCLKFEQTISRLEDKR